MQHSPTAAILLAPMEGVIDHTMRELLTALGGIDRCVTEFLRVSQELLPARVFYRICPELRRGGRTPSGVPVYLQLLGGDPSLLAEHAARGAALGAAGIDLNFGCPAKTVNRSDGGSVILRQPERIYAIVCACRRAMPPALPLTVKLRLGFDNADASHEVISAADAAGPSQLIVHARTRADGYRPPAYWSTIAGARALTRIPIVANGEIWSVEDAQRARRESGCDDLMLGRGVLCRPDLPRLLRARDRGEARPALSWNQVRALLCDYLELTLAHYSPQYAPNVIKQWLAYLRHYYPQAAVLFAKVKRIREPGAMGAALKADGAMVDREHHGLDRGRHGQNGDSADARAA